jgi:hypothetical protein
VDREEEEEAKEMRSLWKKQGKPGELYRQDVEPSGASAPPTTPRAPFREKNHPKKRVTFQLHEKVKGQR